MKTLILILALISASTSAGEFDVVDYLDKTYINIGVGYKFQETVYYFGGEKFDDPVSARIEIGYRYNKNIRFGVSHHSQLLTVWPVNSDHSEPSKTEIFIDYTFTVGSLFW